MADRTRSVHLATPGGRLLHRARHVQLHQALDEIFADYLRHHPTSQPGSYFVLPIGVLLAWSYEQTQEPTEFSDD